MSLKHLNTIGNDSFLHRYIKLDHLPLQFDGDNFLMWFSRIDQFDDPFEGWDLRYPEGIDSLIDVLDYSDRVNRDGGTIEATECLLINMYKFRGGETRDIDPADYKNSIKDYLIAREKLFVSCWYWSPNDIENRAMWETHGSDGIRISFKAKELKNGLDDVPDKTFYGGLVKYGYKKGRAKVFEQKAFYKNPEYFYEKEYRFVWLNDLDNNATGFTEKIAVQKVTITLSPHWSDTKRKMINEWLSHKYEDIVESGFLTIQDSKMRIGKLNTDQYSRLKEIL